MKVKGTFMGRVVEDARLITPKPPSRPFISYTLQGEKDDRGWSVSVECTEYHNKANEEVHKIREGMVLMVFGDVTAKAVVPKREGAKIFGKINIFIRDREQVGVPSEESNYKRQQPQGTQQSQPSAAGPSAAPDQPQGESGDECPY